MTQQLTNNLILVRGLPGSGKTTLARFLESNLRPEIMTLCFAADDYFYDNNDNYVFDMTKLGAAHAKCLSKTEAAMANAERFEEIMKRAKQEFYGTTVIVHNTFTTAKEMKPYKELAEKYKFRLTSLIVENAHGNPSVHNVPDETMVRMMERFKVQL